VSLSRWGDRVEKKLAEPLPQKSFSEKISEVIARSETEDTMRLLFEGLASRIGSHFPMEAIEIVFDPMSMWYVLKARRQLDDEAGPFAKDAVVVINIKEEDITRACRSPREWNAFLDAQSRRMMRELRMQSSYDIPAIFASMQLQAEEMQSALQRMMVTIEETGVAYGRVEKVAEDAAIESIKRTIAERAEQ
jgi:hypothetical protein